VQRDPGVEHLAPPRGNLHLPPVGRLPHALEALREPRVVRRLLGGEPGWIGANEDLEHAGEAELAEARLRLGEPCLERLQPAVGQREGPPPPAAALDRLGHVPRRRAGEPLTLGARLLVGADGRGSRTAEVAKLPTRMGENGRFAYWGYFEGPPLGTGASVHLWLLDSGDVGIVTPTDGGLMLYVAFPRLERAAEFKRDIEGALRAFISALPDAPPIGASTLAGPLVGKLDLTNEWRRTTGDGIALVGDAALAADPVGAIGCGWAVQSAEWLADAVAPALVDGAPLEPALRRYRRRHRRELLGHSRLAADASKAKPLNPVQRVLFSAAVHDPATAEHVEAFAARVIRPSRFLAPRPLARAAAVNLRRATQRQPVAAARC
jgi:menaquinone-9 beta-reductase